MLAIEGGKTLTKKVNVEIYNVLGEKILSDEFSLSSGFAVDLSAQPKGIYLAKINSGSEIYERKIVVQ